VRESRPKGKTKRSLFKIASELPRNTALNLGIDVVDNSSARSFIIRQTKKKTRKADTPFLDLNLRKFRTPKGKTKLIKGSIVEKTKYLIDTQGEINGITAKGLLKLRQNRGAM
jgi:hypothetical protein